MINRLKEITESMNKLEEDINKLQVNLSNDIPSEIRSIVSKELEYKMSIFVMSSARLKGVIDLINNNI